MGPFNGVNLLVIAVVSGLCQVIHCTVVLSPRGKEFICGPTNVSMSRTLTCNVSGTNLRWDISIMGNTPTQHFFDDNQLSSQDPYNVSGIIASLTAITSDTISSALVIPNNRSLLPVTIKCGFSSNQLTYSLMSKDPPDPPTNVSVIKNCGMEDCYIMSWQPSASSASEDKPVEQYLLTITSISDPSHTRALITTNTSISLHLNGATNYTVSLKASNCAGNSSEVVYGITRDLIEPASLASTAATTVATMSFEMSDSARASSNSQRTLSPQTSGAARPITSADPFLGNPRNPFPIDGMLLGIIGAAVAVVILLSIFIIIVTGIIVCYKRRSRLKTVSMETATNVNQGSDGLGENGIYNKLKGYPSFETPELTKHFHNPQYSELMQSSTSSDRGDPLSPNEHIYHVLEGPDPTTKEQLYAEVGDPGSSCNSNHEKWPDKNSVTTESVRLNPPVSSHTTSTHLRYHQTPPSKFPVHTWNYSVH